MNKQIFTLALLTLALPATAFAISGGGAAPAPTAPTNTGGSTTQTAVTVANIASYAKTAAEMAQVVGGAVAALEAAGITPDQSNTGSAFYIAGQSLVNGAAVSSTSLAAKQSGSLGRLGNQKKQKSKNR